MLIFHIFVNLSIDNYQLYSFAIGIRLLLFSITEVFSNIIVAILCTVVFVTYLLAFIENDLFYSPPRFKSTHWLVWLILMSLSFSKMASEFPTAFSRNRGHIIPNILLFDLDVPLFIPFFTHGFYRCFVKRYGVLRMAKC